MSNQDGMGNTTSVHIKPCKIAESELHNARKKNLTYIRSELSERNESYYYIDHSLIDELEIIKKDVKSKTGRKMQKNAIGIREGVIVISNETTMEQLQDYADKCRERWGIIPLQIHIHRDEGHVKAMSWKPNLHAHIVWRWYNTDGRNVRLSRDDMVAMQTLLAECLSMDRGQSSDRKHLDAIAYKIEQASKEVQMLAEEVEVLEELKGETEQAVAEIQGEYNKIVEQRDIANTEICAKEQMVEVLQDTIESLTDERNGLIAKAKEVDDGITELKRVEIELEAEIYGQKVAIEHLEEKEQTIIIQTKRAVEDMQDLAKEIKERGNELDQYAHSIKPISISSTTYTRSTDDIIAKVIEVAKCSWIVDVVKDLAEIAITRIEDIRDICDGSTLRVRKGHHIGGDLHTDTDIEVCISKADRVIVKRSGDRYWDTVHDYLSDLRTRIVEAAQRAQKAIIDKVSMTTQKITTTAEKTLNVVEQARLKFGPDWDKPEQGKKNDNNRKNGLGL